MSFRGRSWGRGARGGGRGFNRGGGYKPYNNNNNNNNSGRDNYRNDQRDYTPKGRGRRGGSHGNDLLSTLDPREQLELTKALVASVFKNKGERKGYREDYQGGRRDYQERDGMRYRDGQDSGNYNKKYEGRNFKDRKQYDDDRPSYSGSKQYDNSEYSSQSKFYGRDKKDSHSYDLHEDGSVRKKMRTEDSSSLKTSRHRERSDSYHKDSDRDDRMSSKHNDYVKKDKKKTKKRTKSGDSRHSLSDREDREGSRKRDSKKSKLKQESDEEDDLSDRKSKKYNESKEKQLKKSKKRARDDEDVDDDDDDKYERKVKREKDEDNAASTEEDADADEDDESNRSKCKDENRSQLSGRSEGGSKFKFKMECPHCPDFTSEDIYEYREHLRRGKHFSHLDGVTKSNWQVVKKIRFRQREEQRAIEDRWKEENKDEYKTTIKSYCQECMLTFRVIRGRAVEGKSDHRKSKLHRMQVKFMRPKCNVCNMLFPKRAVYESHRASVTHLKVKAMLSETTAVKVKDDAAKGSGDEEATPQDKLDMENFITMDSVGGEDESDSDLAAIIEEVTKERKERAEQSKRRRELEKLPREMDWTEEEKENGDEGVSKGEEYMCRIEASFCKLCCKVIRLDKSSADDAIQRHCRTKVHLDNYKELQSDNCMAEAEEGHKDIDLVKTVDESVKEDADNASTNGDQEAEEEVEDEEEEDMNKDDSFLDGQVDVGDEEDEEVERRAGEGNDEMEDMEDEQEEEDNEAGSDEEEEDEEAQGEDTSHFEAEAIDELEAAASD